MDVFDAGYSALVKTPNTKNQTLFPIPLICVHPRSSVFPYDSTVQTSLTLLAPAPRIHYPRLPSHSQIVIYRLEYIL